jgi:hypothetical protein
MGQELETVKTTKGQWTRSSGRRSGLSLRTRYNGWFIGGGTEISLGIPGSGIFANNAENMKPYVQTIWTALVYRFG